MPTLKASAWANVEVFPVKTFCSIGVLSSILLIVTPAKAQDTLGMDASACSARDGSARGECLYKLRETFDREESRIIDSSMNCNHRHMAAGEHSPSGVFPDCDAKVKADLAELNQKRRQLRAAEQQAQAKDSSVKFHYNGKYYVDPVVLQGYAMGAANYGDIAGKDIVVTATRITQVNSRDGKYWGYMGAFGVCVSDAPLPISGITPVSVSGRVRGTVVSTIVRGRDRAQTNTVVIDNCRIGPAEDEDQLWGLAQRGR